jgi:hypothetical protein
MGAFRDNGGKPVTQIDEKREEMPEGGMDLVDKYKEEITKKVDKEVNAWIKKNKLPKRVSGVIKRWMAYKWGETR